MFLNWTKCKKYQDLFNIFFEILKVFHTVNHLFEVEDGKVTFENNINPFDTVY